MTEREIQLELENARLRGALKDCADELGSAYGFAVNGNLSGPYHAILSTPSPDPSRVLRLAAAMYKILKNNFELIADEAAVACAELTPEERALLEGVRSFYGQVAANRNGAQG